MTCFTRNQRRGRYFTSGIEFRIIKIYTYQKDDFRFVMGGAGLLIGHPTGGTIGATIGTIIARRITLLIPVGLEKSLPIDLADAADFMNEPEETVGNVPALWPISGMIFTEIEAFETLAGVEAIPVGAGGIAGAEGSVRLMLRGEDKEIDAASKLVESLRAEKPFVS